MIRNEWIGFCIILLAFFGGLAVGCSTTKGLLEVDTPIGYTCKTHGEHPKAYKVGDRYFCTICVDNNLGKVELLIVPTTTED